MRIINFCFINLALARIDWAGMDICEKNYKLVSSAVDKKIQKMRS